jgi:hypothetical protein
LEIAMALDQRHHEYQLQNRLDELYLTGHCHITWNELYHWFNLDKIAKAPYRKINEMWTELCERHGLAPVEITTRQSTGGVRLFREPSEGVEKADEPLVTLL